MTAYARAIDYGADFFNNPPVRLPLLLGAIVLAGCAAVPPRPAVENPQAVWQAREARLMRLDGWDLRGRLALRAGGEGAHASIRWIRDHDNHRIDLVGPFGGGRTRILLTKDGAELRDAGNKVYRDDSIEELLARVTGWWLPFDSLRYWVVGRPVPDAAARTELDDWGRLKTLEQQGWTIRFIEYAEAGAYELPRRIFIERNSAEAPDTPTEARIVIEQWVLDNTNPEAVAR